MKIKNSYVLLIGNSISWKVKTGTNKQLKLKSNPSFAFVNPKLYHRFVRNTNHISPHVSAFTSNNIFFIDTGAIILKNLEDVEIPLEQTADYVEKLLKYIKFLSGNYNIEAHKPIAAMFRVEKMPQEKYPIGQMDNIKMRKTYLNTKINWDIIKKADEMLLKNEPIPVYCDIFLEALKGVENREFEKAILFSAISIESMMNYQLDLAYSNIIIKPSKEYRVSEFQTSSGSQFKDPIYKKLKKNSNFQSLLHELPLYILKKSLLIEQPELYSKALNLYTTRNKIAHLGGHDGSNNNLIPMTPVGAVSAYNTAVKIFQWMGIFQYSEYETSFTDIK